MRKRAAKQKVKRVSAWGEAIDERASTALRVCVCNHYIILHTQN